MERAPRLSLIAKGTCTKVQVLLLVTVGNILVWKYVYSVKEVSAMAQSSDLVVPSIRACYAKLVELETSYRVRLGLWISIHEEPSGMGYFEIHISGSGELYDRLPKGTGHCRARIIPAFDEPFASALWSGLVQIEACYLRHA